MSKNFSSNEDYEILIQYNTLKILKDFKEKDINIFNQIGLAISKLKENPYKNKVLKGKGKKKHTAKAGNYRIIYHISGNKIRIIDIGHRRHIYKKWNKIIIIFYQIFINIVGECISVSKNNYIGCYYFYIFESRCIIFISNVISNMISSLKVHLNK